MKKILFIVAICSISLFSSCQFMEERKHNKDIEKFVEESLDAQADGDNARLQAIIYSIDEYCRNLTPQERVRCIGYARKYREQLIEDSVYVFNHDF